MRFPVGINLGDVMVEGEDIYGAGVNIAARLQELAEPGGVLVSGSVYEQVYNKLSVGFDFLGHQQVKNVSNPVTSYRVTLDGVKAQSGGSQPHPNQVSMKSAAAVLQSPKGLSVLWNGYMSLPRPIAVALTVGIFLFLINASVGFNRIWFHWPMASLLLVAVLWTVIRRKP